MRELQLGETKFLFLSEAGAVLQLEVWQLNFQQVITEHHTELLRMAVVARAYAVAVEQKKLQPSLSEHEVYATEWLEQALELLGITLVEHTVITTSSGTFSAVAAGIL